MPSIMAFPVIKHALGPCLTTIVFLAVNLRKLLPDVVTIAFRLASSGLACGFALFFSCITGVIDKSGTLARRLPTLRPPRLVVVPSAWICGPFPCQAVAGRPLHAAVLPSPQSPLFRGVQLEGQFNINTQPLPR